MKCAFCGADNGDAAKYCGQCGGPLALARENTVPDVREAEAPCATLPQAAIAYSLGSSLAGTMKVGLLLVLLTAGLVALGGWVGGPGGAAIAFAIALTLNFGSYWYSDRLVLMTTGARQVSPEQAPQLHRIVEELALRAGLPKPTVCIMPQVSPNAFATGRDPRHGVVAVTTGLLQVVDRDQLEGILAHELAHIKNRDGLLCSMVAALAGAVMFLGYIARWGALIFTDDRKGEAIGLLVIGLLAPLGAVLVQMGISRAREYKADEGAAYISGKPAALAGALARLQEAVHQQPLQVHPSASHLFIVPPLPSGWLAGLFRTHPSTEARVARLRKMGGSMG